MGFTKFKNINIRIKLHSFFCVIVLGMAAGLQTNNHNALQSGGHPLDCNSRMQLKSSWFYL